MVREKAMPGGRQGFTLIEILVVIGILAIIVVVGSTSFFNLLRGSTKTKTASLVKENGDYALGVMTRMIRNAQKISVCNPNMTSIEILNPDGGLTEFSFDGDTISSNSAAIISSQVEVKSESCFFDCQEGGPLQPDVVIIGFTLTQADGATGRPEEQVSIDFKTTVSLRNIAE